MVDYSNIPRDSRRVPLATKVQFKFDRFSGFISEYSANISPTGMFIVSSNPEPNGRVLDLEFRLGDGFEIITGKGEVVWTRTVPDGPERPPGMGIRFTELGKGSKDLIYRIVDRYIQEGGIPFDLSSGRDRAPESILEPPPTPVPLAALPPLELEPDPFPDLELDAVKDSSGNPLPWFSGAQPTFREPPAAAASGSELGRGQDEESLNELFPSIGPALEEVEKTFAGQRPLWEEARREETQREGTRPEEALRPAKPTAPSLPTPATPPAPPPLLFPSALPAPTGLDPAPPPLSPIDAFAPVRPAPPPAVTRSPPRQTPPDPAPIAAPTMFADYLPKTASAPEAPQVRTLASLAGSAAAQEPRRVVPWILLGVAVALGAAAFLVRDRLPVWLGLTGGEEETVSARPAGPQPSRAQPPPPPAVVEEGGLTSDVTSETPASPEPSLPEATAPPAALPEVVQRKPGPAAAAGPQLTALDRITYEKSLGGTEIVLWGDGAIRPETYVRSQMGSPPRVLIRFLGIRRPFSPERIQVGTGEVKQVRVGYHASPAGHELHVVIDLAAAGVKVTRVDQDGQRLRIHLQKG